MNQKLARQWMFSRIMTVFHRLIPLCCAMFAPFTPSSFRQKVSFFVFASVLLSDSSNFKDIRRAFMCFHFWKTFLCVASGADAVNSSTQHGYYTEQQQQLRVAMWGFFHSCFVLIAKRRKTSNFGCKVDGILVQAVLSDGWKTIKVVFVEEGRTIELYWSCWKWFDGFIKFWAV